MSKIVELWVQEIQAERKSLTDVPIKLKQEIESILNKKLNK